MCHRGRVRRGTPGLTALCGGKAGTIEHVHHVIKNELGGGVYPSGKHGANAAWLRLPVITHNLLELLQPSPSSKNPRIWEHSGLLTFHYFPVKRESLVIA